MVTKITKRDGSIVDFDKLKILNAIAKANKVTHELSDTDILFVTEKVVNQIDDSNNTVEQIQDLVEESLIQYNFKKTAKEYIIYRETRSKVRNNESFLMDIYNKVTNTDSKNEDIMRENANINTMGSMGVMLKYGSEGSKFFLNNYILPKDIAAAHINGDCHFHDLDFYMLTETCCQIDLDPLFSKGFSTGHGYIRPPQSIESASALTCIVIQSNQNEMHGGQSIPALDYFLAPFVNKTFKKELVNLTHEYLEIKLNLDAIDAKLTINSIKNLDIALPDPDNKEEIDNVISDIFALCYEENFEVSSGEYVDMLKYIVPKAISNTNKRVHQSMESLVHNLNSLASRSGGQVPFSSVNYGTDTSNEGRMLIKNLLRATDEGLGLGETPIFPVQVFKLREGVNYNPDDRNYDLFKYAIKVSAKRLFPNFNSLMSSFNKPYLTEDKRDHNHEVAVMGMVSSGYVKLHLKDHYIPYCTVSIVHLYDFLKEHGLCSKLKQFDEYTYYTEVSDNVFILDSSSGGYVKLKKWMKSRDPNTTWYTVKLKNGYTNNFTHDHPLPVYIEYSSQSADGVRRTQVKDLEVNNFVFIPAENNTTNVERVVFKELCSISDCMIGYDVETSSDYFDIYTQNNEGIISGKELGIVSHNCIDGNTRIVIKDPNGNVIFTTAKFFEKCGEGLTLLQNWQILSSSGFVELKNVSIRKETSHINEISSAGAKLCLTDNHIVPIIRKRVYQEIYAKDIQIDDCLITGDMTVIPEDARLKYINLIDILDPYKDMTDIYSGLIIILPKSFTKTIKKILDSSMDVSKILGYFNIDEISIPFVLYKEIRDTLLSEGLDENDIRITYRYSKYAIPAKLYLTRNLGRFIGLLYAEGSVSNDNKDCNGKITYSCCITNSDEKIVEFAQTFIKEELCLNYHTSTNSNNTKIVTVSNRLLRSFFKDGIFGSHNGSGDLRLSEWMFGANIDFLKGFISGVIDGDGSVVPANYVRIITASETFGRDVQYILHMLGCVSCVSIDRLKGTVAKFGDIESIRKFDNYRVTIDNREALKLDLYDSIKMPKLNGYEFKERTRDIKYSNRVFSIEKKEYSDYVYDFETGDHYFFANCQKLHNCRTRVMGNVYDPSREVTNSRGNLSFTTINLPRLGILAKKDIDKFFKLLDEKIDLCFRQLLHRLDIQKKRKVKNYPFLMLNGIWLDSEKLYPDDEVGDILNHGTLSIGFIGLAETLIALIGKHHGESDEAQELGLKIVKHMYDRCVAKSQEMKLNFTLLATPAESLSSRFTKLDKEKFGVIEGVTDKEWYTNSCHVKVDYPISMYKKIRIEAPYHKYCTAGSILYLEMDSDTTKNLEAFEKVIRYMVEQDAGYMAINHPVDRDPVCGYVGVIDNVCPRCGRKEGEGISLAKLKELRKKYHNVPLAKGYE